MSDLPEKKKTKFLLKNNKKLHEQARQMYYAGLWPTDIAESLDVDIDDLGLCIFGADRSGTHGHCWSMLKSKRPTNSIVTYERVKPYILKSAEAKLMDRVHQSINKMVEDEEVFENISDISAAVSTIEKIDKITRLEEGKATSHVTTSKKSFSLREMVNGMDKSKKITEPERAEGRESNAEVVPRRSILVKNGDKRDWDIRDLGTKSQPEDTGVPSGDDGEVQE